MTVRELLLAIEGAPLDAEVRISFIEHDDFGGEIIDAPVGAVHYDQEENTLTIEEVL